MTPSFTISSPTSASASKSSLRRGVLSIAYPLNIAIVKKITRLASSLFKASEYYTAAAYVFMTIRPINR